MKHIDYRIERLLHEGFSIGTLERFSSKQIQVLYEKVKKNNKKEVKEQPKPVEKTVQQKVIELPSGAKTALGGATVSNEGGKTVITTTATESELEEDEEFDSMDINKGEDDQDPIQKQGPDGMPTESEMYEKATSKKQRGLMGAAYSVEKGYKKMSDIPKSYRGKVKDVVKSMTKKQIKDFASTSDDELKEGFGDIFFKKQKRELESMMMDADAKYEETGNCHYVVKGSWGTFVSDEMPSNEEQVVYDTCEEEVGNIEESILRLVQNHLPPHTTKKQLINYISKKR